MQHCKSIICQYKSKKNFFKRWSTGKDTKSNITATKGNKHISGYLHQGSLQNPISWFQSICINSQSHLPSSESLFPPLERELTLGLALLWVKFVKVEGLLHSKYNSVFSRWFRVSVRGIIYFSVLEEYYHKELFAPLCCLVTESCLTLPWPHGL